MPVVVCRKLFEECRRTGVLTILDESLVDFREHGFFCEKLHADIVVFGEALAGRQMPFGTFLTTSGDFPAFTSFRKTSFSSLLMMY